MERVALSKPRRWPMSVWKEYKSQMQSQPTPTAWFTVVSHIASRINASELHNHIQKALKVEKVSKALQVEASQWNFVRSTHASDCVMFSVSSDMRRQLGDMYTTEEEGTPDLAMDCLETERPDLNYFQRRKFYVVCILFTLFI